MSDFQEKVKRFWTQDTRALAVFEGKIIDSASIDADEKLAERYWNNQLKSCYVNWTIQKMRIPK